MHGTAIVLGATGAVGTQLVIQLSQRVNITDIILLSRRELNLERDFPGAITSKVHTHIIDFDELEQQAAVLMPSGSVAFVALGTTKKQAGSDEAFRRIDHGLVLAFARACKAAEVSRLGVVTAHGANVSSAVFYNRVKGEVERDIQALALPTVFFARPSLLLGRPNDGRFAEKLASALLAPAASLLPKAVRPISTARVAAAMIDVAFDANAKSPPFVLTNADMHQRAHHSS
ncbi:MAG: nucleoside-diphosphate sugar epimerase [Halomonas sp.]|nr:MAG: nucleoside-diphosphate sugar epimerase [Halomonas sp.]